MSLQGGSRINIHVLPEGIGSAEDQWEGDEADAGKRAQPAVVGALQRQVRSVLGGKSTLDGRF